MFFDCFNDDNYEESEWLKVLDFETAIVGIVTAFAKSGSWPTNHNSMLEVIDKCVRRDNSFQSWFRFQMTEDLFLILLEKNVNQILKWLSTSDIQKLQSGPDLNLDILISCQKKSETFYRACLAGTMPPENTQILSKPPESQEEFQQGLNMLINQNSNNGVNLNGYWTTWARKDPMWVVNLAETMMAIPRHCADSEDIYNLVLAFSRATSAKCVYVTNEETKECAYRRRIFGEFSYGILVLPREKLQGEDPLRADAYELLQKYLEWWDNRESLGEMANGRSGIQAIPSELILDELAENRNWERNVALFLRFGIYGIPALLGKLSEHDNGLVFTLLLEIIHDTSYSDILKEVENTILSQRIEETRNHGSSDTPKPVPAETWLTPVGKVVMRYPDYDSRTRLIRAWWNNCRHTYANLPTLQSEIDEAVHKI